MAYPKAEIAKVESLIDAIKHDYANKITANIQHKSILMTERNVKINAIQHDYKIKFLSQGDSLINKIQLDRGLNTDGRNKIIKKVTHNYEVNFLN